MPEKVHPLSLADKLADVLKLTSNNKNGYKH
jgi:hypothetical protein